MNWQELISLLIVGLTMILIIRSEIRKYRLRKILPCGGDCNCTALKIVRLKQIKPEKVRDLL